MKIWKHDQRDHIIHHQLCTNIHVPVSVELRVDRNFEKVLIKIKDSTDNFAQDWTSVVSTNTKYQYCGVHKRENKNRSHQEGISFSHCSVTPESNKGPQDTISK